MNGESSLGPNFASVDDEKAADSVSESSVHEKIDMRSINEKQNLSCFLWTWISQEKA